MAVAMIDNVGDVTRPTKKNGLTLGWQKFDNLGEASVSQSSPSKLLAVLLIRIYLSDLIQL